MNAAWPHGDPRELVRAVLADPRFQRAAAHPAQKSLLQRVLDYLHDLWAKLTEPLRHITGSTKATQIIGIMVLVVVIAGLAFVAARYAGRVRWRPLGRAKRPGAEILGTEADARTLRERALAAAAAGRHHEAAALLWASALRALDERGRVRFDPARTPGEWRSAVRDPSFDAFARDAVIALFGTAGADAALVARMREAYDRVVAPA
ncbi:MAG TPA: hypothetical protein VK665_14140 [Candidatus Elarobacter sp.]|nr:hypothetical protein [Candidatus Elarobacter sp.]